MIAKYFRWVPHPNYGNYGGRVRSNLEKKPIDHLDACFMIHDIDLMKARKMEEYADETLSKNLSSVDSEKLSRYGKLYLWFCRKVF